MWDAGRGKRMRIQRGKLLSRSAIGTRGWRLRRPLIPGDSYNPSIPDSLFPIPDLRRGSVAVECI